MMHSNMIEEGNEKMNSEGQESYINELREEIIRLRRTNAELRAKIDSHISPAEFANVLHEKGELTEVAGYGKFHLKRVDRDRWSISMHNERIELYNRKGHRVRGNLNYDGDW